MPVFVGAGTSSFMKGDGGVGFSTATTTTRNALSGVRPGQIIFNQTTGLPEYYNGSDWIPIDSPPSISSVSPTSVESAAGGNVTFTINGERFGIGSVVKLISNTGVELTPSPVTRVSATQLTAVIARNSFVNAQEPYDVKVTNPSGLSSTLADQINVDNAPTWTTSAGNVGSISDQVGGNHVTLSATDPEGDAITYSEVGSNLSAAGLVLGSSGVISGNPNDVNSSTTVSFTGRATANSKTADRSFNIIVDPYRPVYFGILGAGGGGGGRRSNSYQGSTDDRGSGGGGCFMEAVYEIKLGTVIYYYVGSGGYAGQNSSSGASTNTFGGNGGVSSNDTGGEGGDFSGIFTQNATTQASALIIAGGGGGGAGRPHAGNDNRGLQYGGGQCESATTGEGNDGARGHNTPNHSHGSDRGGQGGQQNAGGLYGTAQNESGNSPGQANGTALYGGQGGTAGGWGGGGGGGGGFFGGGGGADDGNDWGGQGGGAGSSFIRGKITNYSTSAFNSVSATGITYVSGTFRTAAWYGGNGSWGMRTTYDFTSAGYGSGWAQSNSVTPGHGGRENSSYPGAGSNGGNGLVFYRVGASGSYTKLQNAGSLTALTIS